MSRIGAVSEDTVRILHVATEAGVTERLAGALEGKAEQFDVVAETDPRAALERLETAEFDCLVSEYDLAGMDGLEVLEAVRERGWDTPFILFTGNGNEAVASRAISAGVTDYVRKDADREGLSSLVDRIVETCDGERAVTGAESGYEREQLERFLHAFPDTVFVVDEDGQYRDFIVDGDRSLLYDDVEELRGRRWHDVLPDDKADRFLETVRKALATGEQQRIEYQLDVKSGKRWFEARVGPLKTRADRRTAFWIARDITERKRREQEYEQIFNSVHDIIAVRDPETGELVDANEPYAELLGYDREEMQGMQISDVGATDEGYDDERGMEYIEQVMASDEPVEVEWKIEDVDGQTHVMDVRGTAGSITGEDRYLAIGRDITERKRRERAIEMLQGATERLQTAETPTEVASIAVEAASDVLDLPMAVCWFDDGTDRLEPVAATDAAREAGLVSGIGSDRYEYDVFRDGEVTEYTPSEEGQDNPLETGVLLPLGDHGLVAAGRHQAVPADRRILDVAKALADHVATALNRVERAQAVRESERRFRLIAERIDEVIYLAEPDFSEMLYVNPAYEDIWGRPIEELYDDAESFLEGVDERDREAFEAEFESMVAEIEAGNPDERYEFEFRLRQPDGEVRWVAANGYVVELTGEKRRYVGIAEDITERKRREQRLEVFNRILRHNLRNQLDVIRSHAEVLADRTDSSHADRIVASVDELASIGAEARNTDRLMSTEETPAEIELAETVGEVVEDNEQDDRDVTVRTDVPAETVLTHQEALEIAVESAVENAIEHADSTVTVALDEEPGRYVITVTDDGPGIPEEELVPIEVGTETNLQHGRGLGLWQLRWSVDKLNGELSFDTTGGTTVRITVPDQRGSGGTD